MSCLGDFEHHFQVSVGDYIPIVGWCSMRTFTNPCFRWVFFPMGNRPPTSSELRLGYLRLQPMHQGCATSRDGPSARRRGRGRGGCEGLRNEGLGGIQRTKLSYPAWGLVNIEKTMERSTTIFHIVNPLFLCPFSIAMLNYQRVSSKWLVMINGKRNINMVSGSYILGNHQLGDAIFQGNPWISEMCLVIQRICFFFNLDFPKESATKIHNIFPIISHHIFTESISQPMTDPWCCYINAIA